MNQEYITRSICKAAFVEVACGLRCDVRADYSGQSIFVFPLREDVCLAAKTFAGDGVISARKYSDAFGALRSRCRDLRHGLNEKTDATRQEIG
jgi:hypothetical protein